ncbi:MAG: tetratricopeptide repeat protein [Calditrichaeota bacterium]|nr:MAG: tetratricopeptide repeat protein [Calditrichota bacterium]
MNPCFVEAYLALANFYELRNRLDMAIKTIKNLLQINPNLIPGLMALGKLFLSQGDLLNVLTTFEKVINLDPQNADAYYNLGIVYYHNKDYPNAIEFFNKAIEVGNHANAHLYLAYIYELRGEMDRAIEELRTRIRMQKNEKDRFAEEARKHLFEIMKRRGVIDSLLTNAEGKHQ